MPNFYVRKATSGRGLKPTPTKILHEISPLPNKMYEVRKRAKQVSILLTSEDHIDKRKIKEKEKIAWEDKAKKQRIMKQEKKTNNTDNRLSDSSCEEIPIEFHDSSESEIDENKLDNCRGCSENYYKTQLVEDWLQCNICKLWVHENCTEFEDMCSKCGNEEKQKLKDKKGKEKGKKTTG